MEHLILVRHEHLFDRGLDETYFDHTVELFVQTLQELKVDPELIEEAKTVIMPLRKYFEEGAQLARQRQRKLAKDQMIGQVVLWSVVALCAISVVKLMKQSSRSSSKR